MTYSCWMFGSVHSWIFDIHGGFCSSSMQTDSVSVATVVSPSLLPTRPPNTLAFTLVCEFYDGKTDSLSLFKDFFCGFTSVPNTSEMEGSRSANPCQAAFFSFDISFLPILHAPETPCSYLNNSASQVVQSLPHSKSYQRCIEPPQGCGAGQGVSRNNRTSCVMLCWVELCSSLCSRCCPITGRQDWQSQLDGDCRKVEPVSTAVWSL